MKPELRPHQTEALKHLSNGKILCGDVGSGKTMVAAAYYAQKEAPKDVYVITTAKKRDALDWQEEFNKFGVGRERDASLSGVLTVDSWNSIDRYTEVENAFFIFDEQRLVGKGKWSKSFLSIARRNNWILLSATPGDTWLDYIPVFIANGFYKNRTAFTREHVVYNTYAKFPKVDRYLGTGKLVRLRNSLLVEMPFERHTTRHFNRVRVPYDQELYERVVKDRWHVYEERPLRDVAELFGVMRKVVNSHSSRLEQVRGLLATHPRLIVFYNFDYELELLRSLGDSPHGKSSGLSISFAQEGSSISRLEKDPSSVAKTTGKDNSCQTTMTTPASAQSPITQESSDPSSSTLTTSTSPISSSMTPTSTSRNGLEKKLERPRSLTTDVSDENQPSSKTAGTSLKSSEDAGSIGKISVAEWNGHKHEPIPKTDRWVYLVQYTAGAEGWNCIETDAMVFFSLNYSYKTFYQAQGRIDRLNTPYEDLYYYIMRSDASIDSMIWKSLGRKQSFNESSIMKKESF